MKRLTRKGELTTLHTLRSNLRNKACHVLAAKRVQGTYVGGALHMGGHRAAGDSGLRSVKCWKVGQPVGTPFWKPSRFLEP